MEPSAHVLDLFVVPDDLEPLAGGRGDSVRAGDLVLSPGRCAETQDALNPILARLSVALDSRPRRRPRDIRIAMPIPARDGNWVVDGWAATRFEPNTTQLTDLDATLAVGAVLHAEFARAHARWDRRSTDRRGRAERIAFAEQPVPADAPQVVHDLVDACDDTPLGPDQFVHGDLAGNVLLDANGAPVVLDVSPYWRPTMWADAVCVLDSVLWFGAPSDVLGEWSTGARRQAMLRAGIFRILSENDPDLPRFAAALRVIL